MSLSFIFSLVLIALIGYLIYKYLPQPEIDNEVLNSLEDLIVFSKNVIKDSISSDKSFSGSNQRNKQLENKKLMQKALRYCMVGSLPDKLFVKAYLRDALEKVFSFSDAECDLIIPFSKSGRLTHRDKFDIILHHYKKEYGAQALGHIIVKFKINTLRVIDFEYTPEGEEPPKGYYLSKKDIDGIYNITPIKLEKEDKKEIIIQRIYSIIEGLGAVDEIRDQDIDGLSGGVSGMPGNLVDSMDFERYDETRSGASTASYDSIWIFFKGESIHLQCLGFGSQEELIRICQLVYTYDSPGQYDRQKGHVINEMADQSRVVVVGPNMADSWAFWIRKFNEKLIALEDLWKNIDNYSLVTEWISWQMKGDVTSSWTGPQGSGKTMSMKAATTQIYRHKNLRIQEGSFFETWINKTAPFRNSRAFKETTYVKIIDGMIIQRKTDGSVNLISEIADDSLFPVVMNMAQAGSDFTYWSHHSMTADAMVINIATSLVNAGQYSTMREAIAFVVSLLKIDVHFDKREGLRFVERVTEYIPLTESLEYPEDFKEVIETNPSLANARYLKVKFTKLLKDESPIYKTQNIIEFKNGQYVPVNRPSEDLIKRMSNKMREKDVPAFLAFIEKNWPKKEVA
jgi:pilus assembly protein CpaF